MIFHLQGQTESNALKKDSIIAVMDKVNSYQIKESSPFNSRNWKTSTYFTGVMAFHKATGNPKLLGQCVQWAERQDWHVGNEWFFQANNFTCVQTYLEIYMIKKEGRMILDARQYMDSRLKHTEPAYEQSWNYVDALYVGPPAFAMMGKATGEQRYIDFMNRMYWQLAGYLFDEDEGLFYRDMKARRSEKSSNGKKVLWSRGNGWAMASIPRILTYLPKENPNYPKYEKLLQTMAISLKNRQGNDGMWRVNLSDPEEHPNPESSGTAFFVYALAWGINNGILEKETYLPVVHKAWQALYNAVDIDGKVCWGQSVSRDPDNVEKGDSEIYVSGAFLLAGSEVLKL
ncbi:MAG: glycoside hydrolase family 105 protein [Chlorobi bacterium]|nr:glycoside hydrolase family 105 protein [Chlorobiota bacterium]